MVAIFLLAVVWFEVKGLSNMNMFENAPSPGRERRQRQRPSLSPNPPSNLRQQLHEVMRFFHYSARTEDTYWQWTERFLRFHRQAPPPPGPAPLAMNRNTYSPRPSPPFEMEEGVAGGRERRCFGPPVPETSARVAACCSDGLWPPPLLPARPAGGVWTKTRPRGCISHSCNSVASEMG